MSKRWVVNVIFVWWLLSLYKNQSSDNLMDYIPGCREQINFNLGGNHTRRLGAFSITPAFDHQWLIKFSFCRCAPKQTSSERISLRILNNGFLISFWSKFLNFKKSHYYWCNPRQKELKNVIVVANATGLAWFSYICMVVLDGCFLDSFPYVR